MTQLQSFERPYNVVYGEDGGEPQKVPGKEGTAWPIWQAKRMVIALLVAQIDKTEDDDEREALTEVKDAFARATTGEVVWGMIRRWKNRRGKTRFIGVINEGQDYRQAGVNPDPPRKTFFRPSQHHPKPTPKRSVGVPTGQPQPPRQSDAERIAAKMAKSARRAVEGD